MTYIDGQVVRLKPTEIIQGAMIGIMRRLQGMKANREPYHGVGHAFDWQLDIEGALGELALAKYLGVYYAGVGEFRAPDVGENEVRTTAHENGHLLLHDRDDDDRSYWLVTGVNGTYTIRGYIKGRDGKVREYWNDEARSPCYWVPQSKLISDASGDPS